MKPKYYVLLLVLSLCLAIVGCSVTLEKSEKTVGEADLVPVADDILIDIDDVTEGEGNDDELPSKLEDSLKKKIIDKEAGVKGSIADALEKAKTAKIDDRLYLDDIYVVIDNDDVTVSIKQVDFLEDHAVIALYVCNHKDEGVSIDVQDIIVNVDRTMDFAHADVASGDDMILELTVDTRSADTVESIMANVLVYMVDAETEVRLGVAYGLLEVLG